MSGPEWTAFFDEDPYAGFDASGFPEDLEGWGSYHPIFDALINLGRPGLIVEVGSWKGASAINMASIMKRFGIAGKIICIDTWLGTIESYTMRTSMPNLHRGLLYHNGWPHVYYQFLANVVRAGHQDTIIPLPQPSASGLRLIKAMGLEPDLVYIDGSHDYEDVRDDLRRAWDCLAPSGILFGDDYVGWEGVTAAVNEFSVEHGLILLGGFGKFALAKSGNILELFGQRQLIQPDGSCGGLSVVRPGGK